MIFKAVFLCAVIAGASTLAISCTTPAQMSQTENTKPIKTVTLPAAKDFTTVGKPTKTIETPWGPREIYDPAQDEKLQLEYEKLRTDTSFAAQTWSDVQYIYNQNFRWRLIYDYARLGCTQIRDSFCGTIPTDYFNKPCPDEQNFGSDERSECEQEQYRLILPETSALLWSCELNGRPHDNILTQFQNATHVDIQLYTETQCLFWNEDFFD